MHGRVAANTARLSVEARIGLRDLAQCRQQGFGEEGCEARLDATLQPGLSAVLEALGDAGEVDLDDAGSLRRIWECSCAALTRASRWIKLCQRER